MSPRSLLLLEGVAGLIVSLLAYHRQHGSWLLFAILFLAPDLSMLGFLGGARLGAATYNAIHTYLGPLILVGYSILTGDTRLLPITLIWTAHISFDRMLGYGLKYPTRFQDTHLAVERHAAA
jgi:Domain of unknown function (DUF4260)